jgi:transposase
MFKVLVYGSMEGKYAGRALACACRRDINYMWLLGDEPAVDGTKIEACANKYTFVWKKSTGKYQARLETKQNGFMSELCNRYGWPETTPAEGRQRLSALCAEPFVHGRGKRKSQLQRDMETLTEMLQRQGKYEQYNQTFQGRSSFSKTDPDATFMRMKDGHMRNAQLKPQNYERSKTRKFKNDMNLRENMPYDAEKDEYTCKNSKKIRAAYTGQKQSKSGFESVVTYYECEDCSDCLYKKSCTRAKGNRKMQVSKNLLRQREESHAKITSPMGVLLRMNRSIQAEGAFGVIKQDYGFRQFLLRGNKKVRAEILIVAMGCNINKLHNKIQAKRTGSQLFEKLSA